MTDKSGHGLKTTTRETTSDDAVDVPQTHFAQLGNSTPLPEMDPIARLLAAVAICGRTHRRGQSTRSARYLLACLEQRCLKKSHVLVPPEHPGELVGDQVDHLDAQHGAVDQKVAALVEDRVLSVQRA